MPALAVIVSFKRQRDALACHHYASKRYPTVGATLHVSTGTRYPYEIALPSITGGDFQLAIAFIKGFAYSCGAESQIDEVMCRGDERARYGKPPIALAKVRGAS